MYDSGVDEAVVHMIMEREKYDTNKMEMLRAVQREVEWDAEKLSEEIVRTERMNGVAAGTLWWGDWENDGGSENFHGKNVACKEKGIRVQW